MAVGYMLFLKAEILAVPKVVAANFHASLLPAYRGKHPVFWALRNSEPRCGLTIHEMSSGIDTGDIIFQAQVPTKENDSVSSLYERIMEASVPLVSKLVKAVASGEVPRMPQPQEGTSYFGATSEDDFRISWSMKSSRIARWVTATPGQCFFDVGGRRFFLLEVHVSDQIQNGQAGTILSLQPKSCRIAVSDGSIEIHRLRSVEGEVMDAGKVFEIVGLEQGSILGGI
jgi:methionyl-tRNA formyltransferase